MNEVVIYTDGACSGNPGIGGWGAVLICGKSIKEISGVCEHTTNNRMELTAAIQALKCLKRPCKIKLHSDSAYLINSFVKGWIGEWKSKNWHRAKRSIKNVDLWQQLDSFSQIHNITWIKVAGHSGDKFNEICDKLATKQIEGHKESHPLV